MLLSSLNQYLAEIGLILTSLSTIIGWFLNWKLRRSKKKLEKVEVSEILFNKLNAAMLEVAATTENYNKLLNDKFTWDREKIDLTNQVTNLQEIVKELQAEIVELKKGGTNG